MKKIFVLSLALLAGSLFAGEKENLAGEMLSLMGAPAMVKQSQQRMKMQLGAVLKQFEKIPAAKAKAVEAEKKANDLIVKSFNWDGVKDDLIKQYIDAFSIEEMKAIIAFYKSPAGEKMLKKSPVVTRNCMQIIQKKMYAVIPQVEKMISEVKAAAGPAPKTACVGGKCSTSKCGTNCDPKTSKCKAGVCPAKK